MNGWEFTFGNFGSSETYNFGASYSYSGYVTPSAASNWGTVPITASPYTWDLPASLGGSDYTGALIGGFASGLSQVAEIALVPSSGAYGVQTSVAAHVIEMPAIVSTAIGLGYAGYQISQNDYYAAGLTLSGTLGGVVGSAVGSSIGVWAAAALGAELGSVGGVAGAAIGAVGGALVGTIVGYSAFEAAMDFDYEFSFGAPLYMRDEYDQSIIDSNWIDSSYYFY